jgi:hypothetical protein
MFARTAVLLALVLAPVLSGCGGSPVTPSPATPLVPTASSPSASAASASPSAALSPSGNPGAARPFPTRSGEMLAIGRYDSSPPFDLALTFAINEDGWESLHLIGEFFDVARFDGVSRTGAPSRSLAFAHPTTIRGETDVPALGRSPDEIVAAFVARKDVTTSPPEPFALDGREGSRIDLHARASNTIVFGGPAGNLGIGPDRDIRVGIVEVNADVLLVVVSALPDDLDAAWTAVTPILDSVDL